MAPVLSGDLNSHMSSHNLKNIPVVFMLRLFQKMVKVNLKLQNFQKLILYRLVER